MASLASDIFLLSGRTSNTGIGKTSVIIPTGDPRAARRLPLQKHTHFLSVPGQLFLLDAKKFRFLAVKVRR